MKKGLIISSALALALGVGVAVGAHQMQAQKAEAVAAGEAVYLLPTANWKSQSARFAVYTYGSAEVWTDMTPVDGTDYYTATLPASATTAIFCRMNGATTENNWNNKWNQTGDLTLASSGANNICKITDWDVGGWDGTYVPPSDPSAETNDFYVYDKAGLLGNDASKVRVYGFGQESTIKKMDWPGKTEPVSTTTLGAFNMYQVQLSVSYPKFLMNAGGDDTKTVDVEDLADHIGDVLEITSNEAPGAVTWRETSYYTNVPAEDGYYLLGTKNSWQFASAPKLSAGDEQNHAKLLRYEATKDEEFKIAGYFDGVPTYYGRPSDNDNYVVGKTGYANNYLSKSDNRVYVEEDVPEVDGFYLQGSEIGWGWADAEAMTPTSQDGNVAFYMDYEAEVNDEIRVRSFLLTRETHMEWATAHALVIGEAPDQVTYGDVHDNNFRFLIAGHYDIYAKYESDALHFYVALHVDNYQIQMTAVYFNGVEKDTTEAQESQVAYSTANFEPEQPVVQNYVPRGYFYDENCTDPYEPKKFDAAGHLYAKYIKVGYYVISGADNWSIDKAVMMNTQGIGENNYAEAYLVGVKANDTYSFVYYDGEMAGQSGLDSSVPATVAVYEDSHVKFTADGSYAIYYCKDNKIYINAGIVAFITNFMSETGAECKGDSTDEAKLKAVWTRQEYLWGLVGAEEQARVSEPDPADPAKDLIASFTERYNYIVNKYGTAKFNDFIWNRNIAGTKQAISNFAINENGGTFIAIIIVAASVGLAAFGAYILLKRRKEK